MVTRHRISNIHYIGMCCCKKVGFQVFWFWIEQRYQVSIKENVEDVRNLL